MFRPCLLRPGRKNGNPTEIVRFAVNRSYRNYLSSVDGIEEFGIEIKASTRENWFRRRCASPSQSNPRVFFERTLGFAAMTAGICGKRLEFEETFGSPTSASSAKRSRCSNYGSPIRIAEVGVAEEDKISVLLRTFPSMDRKVLETILNTHDNNIDDAIKNLHALCLGETSVRDEPVFISSELQSKDNGREGAINAHNPEVKAAVFPSVESDLELKVTHGSSLVDIFVREMMNASDWPDVRSRALKLLESFKQIVVAHSSSSKEQEIASLKEQLQCLLRDNQILKRAVTIQHEQNSVYEEKLKEVQQLKNIISQYQEQVRTLELNNYTLKIHLQRAQEATSIPGRFHPDIL